MFGTIVRSGCRATLRRHYESMAFLIPNGTEVPAVTASQMREVDRIAVEETGPNLFQMMENAGRNLALQAIDLLGEAWAHARIVVVAGTGGNGGGGICAARHLANRSANVALCLADPEHLGDVPSFQWKIFRSTSGKEITAADLNSASADLIVDALFGYTLNSAPRGPFPMLIRWANKSGIPILALDIPSGVNATSGEALGDYIKPRWTLTLALPKTGLTHANSGELFLADIGIPSAIYRQMGLPYISPFGKTYTSPLRRS